MSQQSNSGLWALQDPVLQALLLRAMIEDALVLGPEPAAKRFFQIMANDIIPDEQWRFRRIDPRQVQPVTKKEFEQMIELFQNILQTFRKIKQ